MPTATQATPSITVSSTGLITASATQTAGYVSAGTKSATKQLTTQAATTYTPTTSNQTIAAGTYCSGVQTIQGDTNLKAENIAEGVSIFGVTGTHSGSGSGGASVETCTVTLANGIGSGIEYAYTSVTNGDINAHQVVNALSPITLTNVLCNSMLIVRINNSAIIPSAKITGEGEYLGVFDAYTHTFKTPSTSGTTSTFTVYDAD